PGNATATTPAEEAAAPATSAAGSAVAPGPAVASGPTVLTRLAVGAVLAVGVVRLLARVLRTGHTGDEHVGANRTQRRQDLALGLVEAVGHAHDADHEPDAGGQAERGEDRATDAPPQLVRGIRQREHAPFSVSDLSSRW